MISKNDINAPNIISLARILLLFVFVAAFLSGNIPIVVACVVLSGISDFLDGYIARKYNMITKLGDILDTVADKLTGITVAVCISCRNSELIPMLMLFLLKELFIITGGLLLVRNGRKASNGNQNEKISIIMFCVSSGFMMYSQIFCKDSVAMRVLVWIFILITVIIMLIYLIRYLVYLQKILCREK